LRLEPGAHLRVGHQVEPGSHLVGNAGLGSRGGERRRWGRYDCALRQRSRSLERTHRENGHRQEKGNPARKGDDRAGA
jgi:hypothetical protein